MFLQHVAQRLLAPGGVAAAVEQAFGVFVLAGGNGSLQAAFAVPFGVGGQAGFDFGRGRPGGGHQPVRDLVVAWVARQRPVEVVPVAIQVHVLVRGAAQPRKAPGVERVQVQKGHARLGGRGMKAGVGEQCVLHARTAEAFHAMAGAADDEQARRVDGAVARHVHGQRFSVAAQQRVAVRLHDQAGGVGRGQEFEPRLGVALREEFRRVQAAPGHRFSRPFPWRPRRAPARPAIPRPGAPRPWRPAG